MTLREATIAIPPCEVARPASPPAATAFLPVRLHDGAAPDVLARTAVAIDAETGRVLYGKRAHARRYPASTTKMMTALLSLEATSGDEHVVSTTDSTTMEGSSVMGLVPGMELTARDLVFGLMLPSGNDAAIELARLVAGTEQHFVDEMNARVDALGLADTHFENPHGLDAPGHYSSAYDLAMIAREAMRNDEFREVVGAWYYPLPWAPDVELVNGNSLLETYPGADGVKIGWTDHAGWTFVSSASRDGHRVIAAVMDTPDRDRDATVLLDWAFSTYAWRDVTPALISEIDTLGSRMPVGGALLVGRACF
ncbi:MAG: D-alanyl-D-alanine carboxypeptidase [Chloroflexi bacterium]|nr:D-alanyl-D-alanine carboxypeptidase [Chloroflexota bacterium]